jgi:uncharacterized protein (TIGR03435 family)
MAIGPVVDARKRGTKVKEVQMLVRVSLILLIVSASSNPMSCFQTNDQLAALRIGNVQTGEPIAHPPKENISQDRVAADAKAKEEAGGAPLFQAVIRPSNSDSGGLFPLPGEITGDGIAFLNLIAVAYQTPFHRVISQVPEVEGKYKVSVVAPRGREELLYPMFQQMVESTFGIRAHRETREMDVLVLRVLRKETSKLRPSRAEKAEHWFVRGKIHADRQPVGVLADVLENFLDRPVVDETELRGDYDWELSYSRADETMVINAVRDELGLEMVPARRPIEVLVVEKADSELPPEA